MSGLQSNPLLSDPSIVQVSSNDQTSINIAAQNQTTSLEPSNVLSQLLDSAMSKAAKETSPEFELKTSSSSSSPKSVKSNRYEISATKSNSSQVYSIDELMSLIPLADATIADQLPPKEFWCLFHVNKKQHFQKEFGGKHNKRNNTFNNNNNNNKKEFENRKKKPDSSDFFGDDVDSVPEWNESTDIDNKMKFEMGDTVEDFERWKQSQRRKNDASDITAGKEPPKPEPQQLSNDVDNFFSFVKTTNTTDDKKNAQDSSSKSSRFSSFFTPPAPETAREEPKPQPPIDLGSSSRFFGGAPPASATASQSSINTPVNTDPSVPPGIQRRSLSGQNQYPGGPPQSNPSHSPEESKMRQMPGHQPLQGHPQIPQIPMAGPHGHVPPMGFPPGLHPGFPIPTGNPPKGQNDSFFMSLMSKNPNEGGNHNSQPENGSQPKNMAQNLPPWLQHNGGQRPQGPFPPHQQQNMPPPGLNQKSDQPQSEGGERGAGPNKMIPPFPFPGAQGMFPPGFMPPGVQLPPQFRNDPNMMRNMPPPSQQGPVPQFMQFPPGMMPPNGVNQGNQPGGRGNNGVLRDQQAPPNGK